MKIAEEKSLSRKRLLQKIGSYNLEELQRMSKGVAKSLQNLPVYKQADCIMFYYPLKREVNLLGIIKEALKQKRVCFPVIDLKEDDLIPYEVKDLVEDFVKGPLEIMQPDRERAREVALQDIDVVIVPGLAFDREKNRLGRGKGFYDRFFKKMDKKTRKLGVAFDFQLITYLPTHPPQDEKVDLVVTESSCV